MRKLIYLVFHDHVQPSFTRFDYFSPERWAAKHSTMLSEIGIKEVKFEYVADDFYLPWEKA